MNIPLSSFRRSFPAASAVALWSMVSISGAAVITTVGSYDPTGGQNNDVDVVATGTQTLADLTAFQAAVASAFGSGFGGVADFEGTTFTATTILDMTYAGGTKTILMTSSAAQNSTAVNASTGSVLATSGGNVLTRANGVSSDTTYTITGITGGIAGEAVTTFAFTLLERNTYTNAGLTYTAKALFSDGSESALASTVIGDSNPSAQNKGTDDTMFIFNAPTGLSITGIVVDSVTNGTTTATQPVFDDIAFITTVIPEPSAIMLVAAGLGGSLIRRRR